MTISSSSSSSSAGVSSVRSFELMLVGVTVIASTGWVFTKSALAEFSPYIFLTLRFLLAAFVIATLCWSDLSKLTRPQWVRGLGTGVLLGFSLLIWILGVDKTNSIGEGAFIVSLTVVFVPLIARVFFGHKVSISVVFALIPAVLGLALLALKPDANQNLSFVLEDAHGLFLLSTIGFALHVIWTGKYAQNIPYLALTTMQLVAIGVVSGIAALMSESWPEELSFLSWIWLLCSAFIATSLRFALQTKALAHLDPNNAAMIFILEPVWTALLGAFFLSERMTGFQVMGCFLIFLALVIYRLPLLISYLKRNRLAKI